MSRPRASFVFTVVNRRLKFINYYKIVVLLLLVIVRYVLVNLGTGSAKKQVVYKNITSLVKVRDFVGIDMTAVVFPGAKLSLPFIDCKLASMMYFFVKVNFMLGMNLRPGGCRWERSAAVGVKLMTRSTGGGLVRGFYVTCHKVLDGRGLCTARAANVLIRGMAGLDVRGCLTKRLKKGRRLNSRVRRGRVSLLVFFHSPLAPRSRRPSIGSVIGLYSVCGVPVTAGVTATRTLVLTLSENSLS